MRKTVLEIFVDELGSGYYLETDTQRCSTKKLFKKLYKIQRKMYWPKSLMDKLMAPTLLKEAIEQVFRCGFYNFFFETFLKVFFKKKGCS